MYYLRKHNSHSSFHRLGPSDDDETDEAGAALPVATILHEKYPAVPQTIRGKLGVLVSKRAEPPVQRRDMLAEEDTRQFGELPHYYGRVGAMRREASSAQSSWDSTRSTRRHPTLSEMMHESLASIRSVGDAIAGYATGAATRGSKSKRWNLPPADIL